MKARKFLSAMLAAIMLFSMLGAFPASAASAAYNDVDDGMWAYGDIMYVTEAGLMNGTGDGKSFSPQMNLTRAMVVTVLYRMEGSPRTSFKDMFVDVKDRQYYSEAVVWAKTYAIVDSTGFDEWGNEFFSPDRDITRQELATEHQTYTHLVSERAAEGTSGYDAWVNRFPELYSFNVDPTKVGDPDCLFTTINFVKNNTVIGSELNYGETYEMFAVKEGNVAYGLDWNDLFVDPTHGDYTFKEGKNYIGFDFDKLGVQ